MSSAIPGAEPNLVAMRDRLRLDLHDAAGETWDDATIERHILRAVAEYSQAHPDPRTTTLTATAGSRDLSVATLTDLVRVEAVEWPAGRYPRAFVPFQHWDDTLTLLVDAPPTAADDVAVYWGALHTCTTAATTVPAAEIDLVLTGAAGYAAQEWATYATNRVNVDRAAVERYAALAARNLARFEMELARRPRPGRVGVRSLTNPAERIGRSDTMSGP